MTHQLRTPLLLLLFSIGTAAGLPAHAQVGAPSVLTYQGVLTDGSGLPVDGLVTLTVSIRESDSDPTILWLDVMDVLVEDGVFQVELGHPGNPIPPLPSPNHVLDVEVDGEPMTPQQPLRSVPYALVANDTALFGGFPLSAFASAAELTRIENSLGAVQANPILDLSGTIELGPDGPVVTGETRFEGGNVLVRTSGGFIGLLAEGAQQDGVRAVSVDDTGFGYGGIFVHDGPSNVRGAGVFALGNQGSAPDLILGANDGSATGDDGRIASDPAFPGSDIALLSNDDVFIDLDDDQSGESSANLLVRGAQNQTLLGVSEAGVDPGDGRPRAPGLLPIAIANVFQDGDLRVGINVLGVKRVDEGEYEVEIDATPNPCTTNFDFFSRYAAVATPIASRQIISAVPFCGDDPPLIIRVDVGTTAGSPRDTSFSLVVYDAGAP